MRQAHQDALIMSVSAMLCFLQSLEPLNETCYVYKVAIISSDPFWLMVSKGLSFYAFSKFMPRFAIMECPSMSQSCSTFAIKCSWQIVYMLFNFAKLVVVDPFMLCI